MKIGKVELNLNNFFRYIYGGFLLCLVLVLSFPRETIWLYKSLDGKDGLIGSSLILSLLIFTIGTAFYLIYKVCISEGIIDTAIHLHLPAFMFHSEEECAFHNLINLEVPVSNVIAAFRLVRDKYFDPDAAKIFFHRHSETHVYYQTATIFFIGAVIKIHFLSILFIILGILFLFSGFIVDKNLCKDECAHLQTKDLVEIKKTLVQARLTQVDIGGQMGVKKDTISKWEFWSRFMTIVQFLVVVGVGTYLTTAQMKSSRNNQYAETMLKFDEKLSSGNNERLILAIEDQKHLLRSNGGLYSEEDLEELLGVYDDLYNFYKMGLINKRFIYNDFSYDLCKAYDNQEVKNYLNQVRKEDGSDFYEGFDKLAQLFK